MGARVGEKNSVEEIDGELVGVEDILESESQKRVLHTKWSGRMRDSGCTDTVFMC